MLSATQPNLASRTLRRGQSFQAALRTQVRVLKALILREIITRFGRHNIGFLWMFVEPMMFSVGITILWTFWGGHGKGILPVAGFALTGYSAVVAWRNCVNRTSSSLSANRALLYHRTVTILDIALSRALLEFSAVTFSLVALSILFSQLRLMSLPQDPLQALIAWVLHGWFVISAGLIAVYLDHVSEVFDRIWHVVTYLTLPFTGAFSMMDWLPKTAQEILLYSPMVHAVEMLREGFFGAGIRAQYDVSYLLTCNITLTALALMLIGRVHKFLATD